MAISRVWLADKKTTVTALFEGHGKLRGDAGRTIADTGLAKAARAICLSVK